MIKRSIPNIILNITFSITLLIATWSALHLVRIGSLIITSGVFIIPLVFILNDIIAIVYGYRKGRNTMLIGFGFAAVAIGYFTLLSYILTPMAITTEPLSSILMLNGVWRVLLASFVAYLFSSWLNDVVYNQVKKFNFKFTPLPAIIATFIGILTDSSMFVLLAFYGIYDMITLLVIISSMTLVKLFIEIGLYPLTQYLVLKIKVIEGDISYPKRF